MADKRLIDSFSKGNGGKGQDSADKVKETIKNAGKKTGKVATTKSAKVTGLYLLFKKGLNNLMLMFFQMLKGIGSLATTAFSSMVAGLTSLGISTTISSIIVSSVLVVTVIAFGLASFLANGFLSEQTSNRAFDCSKIAREKNNEGETVLDATAEEQAKRAYSVFKSLGLADENIAGVLGNWTVESGIDPSTLEGIFDEPFQIGPKKSQALNDFTKYTKNLLANYTIAVDHSAYQFMGEYYAGIGLGQWTGPRAKRLFDFAEKRGGNWYDLNTQLAFMLTPNEDGGDAGRMDFKGWKKESSPESATSTFGYKWEGNIGGTVGKRSQSARFWFSAMKYWSIDNDYAKNVLDQIGESVSKGDSKRVGKFDKRCGKEKVYDNSSIAMAAVSFAYANERLASNNNGTALWQKLMKGIFPGDKYFMSCDRTVAVAVRWSGVDIDYPIGAVFHQEKYLQTSPKWERVDWGGDVNKLQPGDIFIRYVHEVDEHTLIYAGRDAVKAKFPNSPSTFVTVNGSYMQRSPGCGEIYQNLIDNYSVYRNVKPDKSKKYSHLGRVYSRHERIKHKRK